MKKVVFFAFFATALSLTSYAIPSISSIINPYLVNKMDKVFQAETFSFNDSYEISGDWIFNPCNGEQIAFTGSVHSTYHGVINKNKAQFRSHFNTQGVTGVGLSTGTKYRLIEVNNSNDSYSIINCTVKYSSMQSFKIVSQGAADNFTYKLIFSYTYNLCTGEFEITKDDYTFECR